MTGVPYARICNELEITQNSVTYGDWYSPSMYKPELMFENKGTINAIATANGRSDFTFRYLWYYSSTEINSSTVYCKYYYD